MYPYLDAEKSLFYAEWGISLGAGFSTVIYTILMFAFIIWWIAFAAILGSDVKQYSSKRSHFIIPEDTQDFFYRLFIGNVSYIVCSVGWLIWLMVKHGAIGISYVWKGIFKNEIPV